MSSADPNALTSSVQVNPTPATVPPDPIEVRDARLIQMREQIQRERIPQFQTNVGDFERFASNVAGGLLIAAALKRRGWPGLVLGGAGAALIYRGVTGNSYLYRALGIDTSKIDRLQDDASPYGVPAQAGVRVEESITVDRPAEALYAFWRDHANLPQFMPRIREVVSPDNRTARWVMEGPFSQSIAWNTEILTDEPGRMFSWASTGGAIATAGSVRFEPDPMGRGTLVRVEAKYDPPLGKVGINIARLLGMDPRDLTRETLRRFKRFHETGELLTTEGQPRLA
jgi:uncharacterized membrane protein